MCQTTYKMSAVLPNKNFSKPKYLLYFLCYKMFCPIRRCLIACRALQILQNVCILHFAHLYIRTHIVIIKRKKKHQKNREKSLTRPGPCRDVSLDSHPCPSHMLLDVSAGFPSTVTHHFTSPSLDNSVSPIIVPILLRQAKHLSLIAPSSVSNSVRDGGTFGGPQFFTFSSAESHENCLHFKVAPVINDKNIQSTLL